MMVVGASQQGKSTFVIKLLENQSKIFTKPFGEVIYSYLTQKPDVKGINIEFVHGLKYDILDYVRPEPCLYICDDLMSKFEGDFFLKLMTTARHNNVSVIIMLHDLYFKGKHFTSGTRSATHLVLFGNPRDKSSIKTLSYPINPKYSNFLYSAWEDATKQPFNPLIIDLLPNTPENLRFLSGILPDQVCYSYLPE